MKGAHLRKHLLFKPLKLKQCLVSNVCFYFKIIPHGLQDTAFITIMLLIIPFKLPNEFGIVKAELLLLTQMYSIKT